MSPLPTSGTVSALSSRIGRRLVTLFAGCALLPLVVFAWLAVTSATRQMREELRNSLHDAAKTAGMGIAARASQVAGDLALLRETLRASADAVPSALLQHVSDRCAGVWLEHAAGATPLGGERPAVLPPLGAGELQHLATGKPLLRSSASAGLVMALAVDDHGRRVVARIRPDWFWDPEELRVAGSEVAVFDGQWGPLFHTFGILPDLGPLQRAAVQRQPTGTVGWTAAGEPHLACLWRAFLRPQYGLEFMVVQSRAEREALAGSSGFLWWFVGAAASTLCLVLLASLVQIRRTLVPIVSLREATRRLAAGDLGVRVALRDRDEFGALGCAFDDMAAQLQENVRRREQTERELIASRDAALAAVHAKAEFVTNVSHELRTPMTEILSAVEILSQLHQDDDDARVEFSVIALRGAERLAALVDDVLELDSVRPLELAPLSFEASLRTAVAALAPNQAERVRLDFAVGLPTGEADGVQVGEAFVRLLDNACKFSPAGSPVDLRARCVAGTLVVEIEDHGVGIAVADQQRIFEPFCQVGRDQLVDKAGGTGLGLSLAKRTIERHGGRIELDSQPGRGSTFRVVLPVAVASAAVS